MSLTGATGGEPMRAGVAVIDLMTGLYAANAIQAAIRHRERTGLGQAIDLALLDVQVATLANQALGYLVSGRNPHRWGNAHPSIVPYQSFATMDGDIALAAANDGQFSRLCNSIGAPELAADPRYARNTDRVSNRAGLIARLQTILADGTTAHWLRKLETAGVPAGSVNDIAAVFADPQVIHRGMRTALPHPTLKEVPEVRSPIRLSESPVGAKSAPPPLGHDTRAVLSERLGLEQATLDELCAQGVIG
ncbi:CaiB/BaiF CoA transferase family protein [Flavisphingomonas formosensis]|uniref:CaiB/BaiF CoA transferase family protein n=1 Tax=Flavisphingomonas formosensis TaxID=861534 RepID=UPI002FCCD801